MARVTMTSSGRDDRPRSLELWLRGRVVGELEQRLGIRAVRVEAGHTIVRVVVTEDELDELARRLHAAGLAVTGVLPA